MQVVKIAEGCNGGIVCKEEAEEEKSSSRAMTFLAFSVWMESMGSWVAQKRRAGGVIEIPSKS